MSKQINGFITWIKTFLDDAYADITHNHDDRYYTENEVDSALNGKQSTLVSGTNIKTINNESLLGNGNINISGGSGGIVGVATSLELVSKNDNPNGVLCFNNVEDNYIEKSSTNGLMKNDGSVDTTQYLSSLPSHNHDDRYYTENEIDSALSGKQATLVSGTNIKTVNNQSLLGSGNIDIQGSGGSDGDDGVGIASISKTGTSGLVDTYTITYSDSTTSTFTVTNGSDATVTIQTSWGSTTSDSKVPSEKLTKTALDGKAPNGHTHDDYDVEVTDMEIQGDWGISSQGEFNTNVYGVIGNLDSALSNTVRTTDIANNLTTTTSGKVLDARQGKALADLIGNAITYINQ